MGDTYAGQICDTLSAILNAAVDDGRIPRNPMRSQSVRVPRRTQRKVKAWDSDQVAAVLDAMADRFKGLVVLGTGCSLRQGELFGVAEEDIDYEAGIVRVDRQVKLKNSRPFFALPKHEKTREVPLPDQVAEALRAHVRAFPAREVTLPWESLDGSLRTHRLVFTRDTGTVLIRDRFNSTHWKPAIARAGIIPMPGKGEKYAAAEDDGCHALRHHYASVLLDAGESIRALSEHSATRTRRSPCGPTRTCSRAPSAGHGTQWMRPSARPSRP
ncbi:tyrosine-type recombinase/integrase [Streptomyces litchfieldiae]|uniref:Tyrosine-type recombinase/integrase n=1 Tax=Streptomyces litchfieldiae TaxID=3075543 RepID=A0ABU2MK00_9ACTN|nr:tyrosine-type recombinase/integrase [Streptomyces sp. DSM 44938]MDT0341806.1 tyrosine-type recombinase/integrase [Streptomyces sp. DSM 44938]